MSKVQSIHIHFLQHPRDDGEDFSYEQVYFFLKSLGWTLDLSKPIEFLRFNPIDDVDYVDLEVKNEAELLEMVRKKDALNETLGLGLYNDGELSFTFKLSKEELGTFYFWFMVNGQIVGQGPCIAFEQLARKIVKPFCDKYDVQDLQLTHG